MARTNVEVMFLSAREATVRYRTVRSDALDGSDPDTVAVALAGPDARLVHSTSWRYEPTGTVVLTYVATPDPDPTFARDLETRLVVSSGDPLRPRPAALHEHHVAAHGVRHIAELALTDPSLREVVAADPELWDLLVDTAASTRTGTHDAHDDAAQSA